MAEDKQLHYARIALQDQFSGLCDGLDLVRYLAECGADLGGDSLTDHDDPGTLSQSLGAVDASVATLMELKSALLRQPLPSTLLSRMGVALSRLQRSVADLHTPAAELTRLTALCSEDWAKKGEV